MNTQTRPLGLLTCSVGLLMSVAAPAATLVFQGGSINTNAGWLDENSATGTPTNGDTATIAVDGTITSGTTNFGSAVITQTGGDLTVSAANTNFNFNGAGGVYNLEGGSLTLRGLQANGNGTTINLTGGLVQLGATTNTGIGFGVNNGGVLTIGGTATIDSARAITNQFNNGDFNFLSDWTGSFTVAAFENPGEWVNLISEFGATFEGTPVTAANFDDIFETSADGFTITLVPVPEPTSVSLAALAGLGLLRRRR